MHSLLTDAVLQADFCSGYVDQFGKWNTGFPCPWVDSTVPGFCCGTEHYKYCCSGKMMVAPAPPPPPEDPYAPLERALTNRAPLKTCFSPLSRQIAPRPGHHARRGGRHHPAHPRRLLRLPGLPAAQKTTPRY